MPKYKVVFVNRDREDLYIEAYGIVPNGDNPVICFIDDRGKNLSTIPTDQVLYVVDESKGEGGGEKVSQI